MAADVRYQTKLFGGEPLSIDGTFATLTRVWLDPSSWVDVAPSWICGTEGLFDELVATRPWAQRTRWMYDHEVLEPRLTARWTLESGQPLEPVALERVRQALSARYDVVFDSIGFNLYRDGRDSVAWHRDRIRLDIPEPVVALISLGEQRKLAFRPRGGGRSRAFPMGPGDLLVTGGTTQRTWEHAILKVARAGPRLSLAYRHGLDLAGYDSQESPT